MSSLKKSTIVRFRNAGLRGYYRYAEHVAPGRAGRAACDLWFTAPPRMADFPVPERRQPFEVEAQGHAVRGLVWGDGAAGTVYLVHGWGGRGAQFAAMVAPLVEAGHRVVMFDAPAHGDSDHGPAGPGRTNGVEFAKALDAVFCRFGPAEAVVAHSMGTISTYLAMRFGWLGARAPGVHRAHGRVRVVVRPVPAGARLRSSRPGRVRPRGRRVRRRAGGRVRRPRPGSARRRAAHAGDHRPRRPADGVRRRGRLRRVDRGRRWSRPKDWGTARSCATPPWSSGWWTSSAPSDELGRIGLSPKCSNPQAWPLWRGRTGGRSRFACGSDSCLRFASSSGHDSTRPCCWGC